MTTSQIPPPAESPSSRPCPDCADTLTSPRCANCGWEPGLVPVAQTQTADWPVTTLTVGQVVVMACGVLMFICSFLHWYSGAGGSGANAWSTTTIPGLVLTATWVPLLSLAIAALVAIRAFGSVLPDTVAGFTWAQLAVFVGLFDVLVTLGLLVANRTLGTVGSINLGIGLILSFLTALVLLAGAILDHVGIGPAIASSEHHRAHAEPPAH